MVLTFFCLKSDLIRNIFWAPNRKKKISIKKRKTITSFDKIYLIQFNMDSIIYSSLLNCGHYFLIHRECYCYRRISIWFIFWKIRHRYQKYLQNMFKIATKFVLNSSLIKFRNRVRRQIRTKKPLKNIGSKWRYKALNKLTKINCHWNCVWNSYSRKNSMREFFCANYYSCLNFLHWFQIQTFAFCIHYSKAHFS